MDDDFTPVLSAILLLLILLLAGFASGSFKATRQTNAEWAADCAKLGAHRVDDVVYECKERK